jgi:hypothetical protein
MFSGVFITWKGGLEFWDHWHMRESSDFLEFLDVRFQHFGVSVRRVWDVML